MRIRKVFAERFTTTFILFAALIFAAAAPLKVAGGEETLTVMSFNVLRDAWAREGVPDWGTRRSVVFATVNKYMPEILGLQEESGPQLTDILNNLPAYESPTSWNPNGGHILIRKASWNVIRQGKISIPRNGREVSWVLVESIANHEKWLFYNGHFWHASAADRMTAAEAVTDHIMAAGLNGIPAVLLGDLNCTDESDTMQYLLSEKDEMITFTSAYTAVATNNLLWGTYHGYTGEKEGNRIDHILGNENVQVVDSTILNDEKDDTVSPAIWPSDHYPVLATLRMSHTNNTAPLVNAGLSQTIQLPTNRVTLAGIVTADSVSNVWSKVSGPGPVVFGNAGNVQTTATFSEAGDYILRLTASDGELSGSDDVQITVQYEPGTSLPPVGLWEFENTGNLGAATVGSDLILNGSGIVASAGPGGSDVTGVSVDSGSYFTLTHNIPLDESAGIRVNKYTLLMDIMYDNSDWKSLYQAGLHGVEGAEVWIRSDTDKIGVADLGYSGSSLAQGNWYRVVITINNGVARKIYVNGTQWLNGTVGSIDDRFSLPESFTLFDNPEGLTAEGQMYGSTVAIWNEELTADMVANLGSAGNPVPVSENTAPSVNAGADQTIQLPTDQVSLDGTVEDDGLPEGSTVTSIWTRVSGEGTVDFADASSVDTTATFSEAGEYVLRLTASDTERSASADVQITVWDENVVNTAPQVNAGDDQTIQLPTDQVSLDGTIEDDGLPEGFTVTSLWTRVSGEGSVDFADAPSVDTTATFSEAGEYVLQLTASDGELTTNDTVQITVEDEQIVVAVAAINCGGSAYTATDGTVYSADTNYSGGSTYWSGNAIAGTEDDTLYKSERYGDVTYSIPAVNGDYEVTLKMAELYFSTVGARLFDVLIEGTLVVDDLDLIAVAGHDVAYDLTVPVTVSDGALTIQVAGVTDNAKMNAVLAEKVVTESPYDVWTDQFGGVDAIGSATNDYDLDGISNFGEYALNGNPTNASARGMVEFNMRGSMMSFVYASNSVDDSLTYRLMDRTNLVAGTVRTNGWDSQSVGPASGDYVTVSNRYSTATDTRFIWLEVEMP